MRVGSGRRILRSDAQPAVCRALLHQPGPAEDLARPLAQAALEPGNVCLPDGDGSPVSSSHCLARSSGKSLLVSQLPTAAPVTVSVSVAGMILPVSRGMRAATASCVSRSPSRKCSDSRWAWGSEKSHFLGKSAIWTMNDLGNRTVLRQR